MFQCDCCGCCCRNLDKSELYKGLHHGDGVCIYLKDNCCSIYETRPLICRVDACYDAYFYQFMTRKEYYLSNERVCRELKKLEE